MLRRLLIFTVCFAALLAAALAVLPWWLEPVLTRIGRAQGATFGAYERLGYARFALHDVVVRRARVQVNVARAEADTPVVWLWHRWTGRPAEIVTGKWSADVAPAAAAPVQPSETGGWLPLQSVLIRIAAGLEHWAPRTRIGAGRVSWPGGGLTLASAAWSARKLTVENLELGPWRGRAALAFPGDDVLRLVLQPAGTHDTARLESHGASVTGRGTWWEQEVTLAATFDAHGWLPAAATLQADAWTVPGARLQLGNLYATVSGHGKIEWRDDHFTAEAAIAGEPRAGQPAPPLTATLRGHGTTQSFTIEELHATLPGLTAQLSDPVTVDRQGRFQPGAARFLLEADLAKQPWFTAQGTVSGEARLGTGVTQSPAVEFELQARDVTAGEFTLSHANVTGRFAWPRLDVTTATFTLAPGETLTGHGGWDFQTKEILAATLAGKIPRTALAHWLPAEPVFDTLTIEAEAAGPLDNITHSGHAHADGVQWLRLNPFALTATWSGHGRRLDNFTAEAQAGATILTAAGATTDTTIALTDLTLSQGNATLLKLAAPATVQWNPALQIDSLQLTGEGDASIAVTPGATGHVELTLHKVLSGWLADLAPLPGPAWQLNSFTFTGRWDHGPMTYAVNGDAALELDAGRTAQIGLAAQGDPSGLKVETLRATEGETAIVTATGHIPLVFFPGTAPAVRIDPHGALVIDATTEPGGLLWEKLAELTGLGFKEPKVTAHVTGTWAQPRGELHLQAAQVTVDPRRFARPLPALEALTVSATGNARGLKIETFSANINGQAVRAQGQLTVGPDGWSELTKNPLAFARRQAELHLELPDVDLTAWSSLLPAWLAPRGHLQADLNYAGNDAVRGWLRVHDAATLPLGAIGVLQQINGEVKLTGRTAELGQVKATAGGQPVTLSGTIEYPATAGLRYDVSLRGANLPFAREPGLLVRGDLNLTLHSGAAGPPLLAGTVGLRDSLFLSDVRSFLPGQTRGATQPPPYFSVGLPPFNTWRLDVAVSGAGFLRLRTPLFNGTASARFHVGGTLGDPHVIGEVTIDTGQVLMPFARFDVQQGSVRLTEEKPHELALYLRGTGRRYDYDLTMEITGTPEAPSVVFTSSPALDPEQLLLMVMTGVVPASEFAYSRTQRFARLGTYLGQSLLNSFGGDAANADRLSIATGENISQEGRETYDVEYKLNDRWKVIGEYDEFDDYNIGLKWRLYPGKTKPEAPKNENK